METGKELLPPSQTLIWHFFSIKEFHEKSKKVFFFSVSTLTRFWIFLRNDYTIDQINFLFVANVVFQCYHFSKQFLSNLSKMKYLAFFITFCFVVGLAKMVTLTNNIVYKKSAQYRKYICHWPSFIIKNNYHSFFLQYFYWK